MVNSWVQSLILTSVLPFAHTIAGPPTFDKESLLIRQAPEGPDLDGIYFDDPDSKCSAREKKIIERTFHNMRNFATPAADVVAEKQISRDALFLKFFGDGWDKTRDRRFRYAELEFNFRAVAGFATDGITSEFGDRHEVANRLTIRCDDIDKSCKGGKYVVPSSPISKFRA